MRKISRLLLVSAVLLSVTSCGLGTQVPQTSLQGPAGDGVSATIGSLKVIGATVVLTEAGQAVLSASVYNEATKADALVQIAINDVSAGLTPADITVPGQGLVRFGFNSNSSAEVTTNIKVGSYVKVTFLFASAGRLDIRALVVAQTGIYADVTPAAATSPSASASPSVK